MVHTSASLDFKAQGLKGNGNLDKFSFDRSPRLE